MVNCCPVVGCCSRSDLVFVLVGVCRSRGNCSECFAFLGFRFFRCCVSRLHSDHYRQSFSKRRSFCLRLVLTVSGVFPVVSSTLSIGENSMDFGLGSSAFGIGVDSVVFFSTSTTLWSGVSSSISMAGSAYFPSVPSFVLFSVLLLVLTMLTEKFFFVIFGSMSFYVATSYILSLIQ